MAGGSYIVVQSVPPHHGTSMNVAISRPSSAERIERYGTTTSRPPGTGMTSESGPSRRLPTSTPSCAQAMASPICGYMRSPCATNSGSARTRPSGKGGWSTYPLYAAAAASGGTGRFSSVVANNAGAPGGTGRLKRATWVADNASRYRSSNVTRSACPVRISLRQTWSGPAAGFA